MVMNSHGKQMASLMDLFQLLTLGRFSGLRVQRSSGLILFGSKALFLIMLSTCGLLMRIASQPAHAWHRGGLNISTSCPLCSCFQETRDHLLINCDYSKAVWQLLFERLDPAHRGLFSWTELLSWIRGPQTSPAVTLRRISVQAIIFHLWKQCNNVIHNQISLSTAVVFRLVDRDVRTIITAKRQRKNFASLMSSWLR
ncbi:hypothetical protein F2Q69_00054710 [Brassica cretica]|uniref:Reverse transcriptase zinc-binding domain-containing protein n=1 Tax=Brassica cretica TaxID=69181 RepID=A0A8S9MU21_BRACR|nr:hypothetical protein F2Q69_00054710 [Brassica cretica]